MLIFDTFSVSSLEILSTIQEIHGFLRIQDYEHESFPYLRNLRRIGSINSTDLYMLVCGFTSKIEKNMSMFSMYMLFCAISVVPSTFEFISNNQLREIDLSSLEEVIGGGITASFNPELCFSGNLSHFSQQPNCIGSYRKAAEFCCMFLENNL